MQVTKKTNSKKDADLYWRRHSQISHPNVYIIIQCIPLKPNANIPILIRDSLEECHSNKRRVQLHRVIPINTILDFIRNDINNVIIKKRKPLSQLIKKKPSTRIYINKKRGIILQLESIKVIQPDKIKKRSPHTMGVKELRQERLISNMKIEIVS